MTEIGHLPAGISHILFGRYELYRVHPPLVRTVAALPVVFARPSTDWSRYDVRPFTRRELDVGQDFLRANGSRSFWLFTIARWACIPFSLIGAYVALRWAREAFGMASGLVALTLWCFSPNLLAHGSLITGDAAAAALALAASYTFWTWTKEKSWRGALICGAVLGAAQLAKTTLVVLYIVFPTLWLIVRLAEPKQKRSRGLLCEAWMGGLIVLVSVIVINIGYGFQGTGELLREYRFQSSFFSGDRRQEIDSARSTNRFAKTVVGAIPVPLPREYLQGIDAQKADLEKRTRSYLGGTWQAGGWWYFYLYALAVKLPLGLLMLIALSIIATVASNKYRASLKTEFALLAPAAALFCVVSSQTGLSLHPRYVLPAVPFLLVWASKVARSFEFPGRALPSVVAVALSAVAASSLWIFPHNLSYFNELTGGPRHGMAHLVNSGLSWGQDLPFLKRWMDRHSMVHPLSLASYGYVDPKLEGIEFRLPRVKKPTDGKQHRVMRSVADLRPGWYAIDVNYLVGCDEPIPDGLGGKCVPSDYGLDLRQFRELQPVARAGYSFLIYHIEPNVRVAPERKAGKS